MTLQDALFNWLQMKIISEARPDDRAAKDTLDFFAEILEEDHHLTKIEVTVDSKHHSNRDMEQYRIDFELNGQVQTQKFPCEVADKLLEDIKSNPKYNE